MKIEIDVDAEPKTVVVITIAPDDRIGLRIFGEMPAHFEDYIAIFERAKGVAHDRVGTQAPPDQVDPSL